MTFTPLTFALLNSLFPGGPTTITLPALTGAGVSMRALTRVALGDDTNIPEEWMEGLRAQFNPNFLEVEVMLRLIRAIEELTEKL